MNNQKLEVFKRNALAQGYSPQEIDAFIAQQTAKTTSPAQVQTPQPQTEPKKGVAARVGEAAMGLAKDIAKPFVNTAANVGTAMITVPQTAAAALASRFNKELGAKIAEKDILGTQSLAGEVSKDPKKALVQQAKDSAEVASYAIPFGKGKNFLTKAALPGAGVGAIQGLNEEDATAESVVGSSLLGAGGAVALHGLSKIPGALKGAGRKVEKVGTKARTGNVTLKSSLGGAADEKAVTATLEKYGIKGTPQKRYEMLEPTVEKISKDINAILTTSPKQVTRDQLEAIFNKKIAPIVEQGDITLPEAQQAFKSYLDDVMAVNPELFQNGVSDTQRLFNLKKNVQASTSQVAVAMRKAENKSALTSTQKSMKAIRDTLDEVVSTLNPEVKELTMDQSRLYDAVVPLSNQRKTVPTVRALGITIPKGPTNTAIDAGGALAEKTGRATQRIGEMLPEMEVNNITGQTAARTPLLPEENNQDNLQDIQGNEGQNNTSGNLDQSLTPPIGGQLPSIDGNYITGYSPEQLYAGYQQALAAGDNANASILRKMYDDETAYQKNTNPSKKPMSAAGLQVQGKAEAGIKAINTIEQQIENNPAILLQASIPGSPGARVYEAAVSSLTDAIGGLRTGASVSPTQQKYYRNLLPKAGDSPETIAYKLESLKTELKTYLQGSGSVQDTTSLPSIPPAL